MPTSLKRLLRLAATLLSIALLVYLLAQQGWTEVAAAFHSIPPTRLLLAFAIMLLSRLAVSTRWYSLLRAAAAPIRYRDSLRLTFTGLFATNFLPTTIGGDVIRMAGALQLQLDGPLTAASLIVDRLIGVTGMALLSPIGLPYLLQSSPALTGYRLPTSDHYLPGVAIPWLRTAHHKLIDIARRILHALSYWLHQPRALLIALSINAVHMLCLFSVIAVLLRAMGESAPLWKIGGLYSLVYFITILPISINGYGFQEVSMTFVFSSLAGASVSNALTLALLFRTLMMLASLPGVFFLPAILSASHTETQHEPRPQ